MSERWHLHCKSCDSAPEDMDWNHGEKALTEVWRLRDEIRAVCDSKADLEVRRFGLQMDTAWLREHGPHDVELRSEYGTSEPVPE